MCGIFGFSIYGNSNIRNLKELTNNLAEESAVRGTDATGIAFNSGGKVNVWKEPKSAFRVNIKHPDTVKALIGHTRHATQGSEKKNINNHPFYGKCGQTKFALTHNGVLSNDDYLRKEFILPKTKIETDSYIAVQLLERNKEISIDSIKFMAEAISGSFSFSILDDKDNIWLVKGDSPLSILHFPKLKLYIYASTDEILWRALIESALFRHMKEGSFEEVKIQSGDILKICSNGKLIYDKFNYTDYSGFGCYDWLNYRNTPAHNNRYLEDLKMIAAYHGYAPEQIDELFTEGFTPEEIEEYLYTGDFMEV